MAQDSTRSHHVYLISFLLAGEVLAGPGSHFAEQESKVASIEAGGPAGLHGGKPRGPVASSRACPDPHVPVVRLRRGYQLEGGSCMGAPAACPLQSGGSSCRLGPQESRPAREGGQGCWLSSCGAQAPS